MGWVSVLSRHVEAVHFGDAVAIQIVVTYSMKNSLVAGRFHLPWLHHRLRFRETLIATRSRLSGVEAGSGPPHRAPDLDDGLGMNPHTTTLSSCQASHPQTQRNQRGLSSSTTGAGPALASQPAKAAYQCMDFVMALIVGGHDLAPSALGRGP